MDYKEQKSVTKFKRMKLFGIAGYSITALAGIGLLIWWFMNFRTGIFDFYQAYIVGAGAGLTILGITCTIKSLLLIKNSVKLAEAALQRPDKTSQFQKSRAMAMGFKLYMCTMVLALIFIGQVVNYTSFVVCLFSIVFAYLCYVGCSFLVGKK